MDYVLPPVATFVLRELVVTTLSNDLFKGTEAAALAPIFGEIVAGKLAHAHE
jgi:hypothetical protein